MSRIEYLIVFFFKRFKFYCIVPRASNSMADAAIQLWIIGWNGNSLEKITRISLGSCLLVTRCLWNAQKKNIHYCFMNNNAIIKSFVTTREFLKYHLEYQCILPLIFIAASFPVHTQKIVNPCPNFYRLNSKEWIFQLNKIFVYSIATLISNSPAAYWKYDNKWKNYSLCTWLYNNIYSATHWS